MTGAAHWDGVYRGRPADQVSWFQTEPRVSLRLVRQALLGRRGAVLDVGGGTSTLVDALLAEDLADVTLLDVSATALATTVQRLAGRTVEAVCADLLDWQPGRRYDVWHDRAVFHFLTRAADRAAYAERLAAALAPGGAAVIGTFAEDGPTSCSGLPTMRYDPVTLAATAGPGLTLEHAEREEHRTPGGAVQSFTWVVLRRP